MAVEFIAIRKYKGLNSPDLIITQNAEWFTQIGNFSSRAPTVPFYPLGERARRISLLVSLICFAVNKNGISTPGLYISQGSQPLNLILFH